MDAVALIADVADSRRITDFPARRDRVLAALSDRHRAQGWIEFDYAVTAWDEFQGLVERPAALPGLVWDFWRVFQPWSLRLALGIGPVERVSGPEARLPLNEAVTGSAFYLAREALEALDGAGHGRSRVRVRVAATRPEPATGANAVLRLADALAQDITERQWQVIGHYEQSGKQTDVAAALGVSESTISRTLASARYWEIGASLEELGELLESLLDPAPAAQAAGGG
jgi:hypothetical protein